MRILVVTPWYPEDGDGSGSFVRDQALAVSGAHDVAVVHLHSRTGAGEREERDEGIRVVRCRARARRLPGTSTAREVAVTAVAERRLARHGFRADLVHAHVYTAALAALPVARGRRLPLVVSEHYSGVARGQLGPWSRFAAGRAYRAAGVVCPVSENLGAAVNALSTRARIEVMPNGVDIRLFHPPDGERDPGPVRVLVVASLVPVKGVPRLIDAVGRVARDGSDLRLTVVGDGPQREECGRRAGAAGVLDRVDFRGRLPRDRVAAEMRAADVLVVPSEWETFSVAAAEGMCSGLPVLASRVGALTELVDPGAGLLVDAGDPEALAEGLGLMLARARHFDRRALAARSAERFSAERVGRQWDALYRRLGAR